MKRHVVVYLIAVFLVCRMEANAEERGPAQDVPELRALQNYIGSWDVVVTNGDFAKGASTARWILGGRFVEQSGFMVSRDGATRVSVKTLYTFDTTNKSYRSWTFLSDGTTHQAELTWDAKSKTMTSETVPNAAGVRSKVTADFSEPGKERWGFVFTDRDRKVVGEMRGVNTLRVEEPPL